MFVLSKDTRYNKITNTYDKSRCMDVPKDVMIKWVTLRQDGDAKRIVESMEANSRVSKESINRAFRFGKCSERVFTAIAKFYNARAERIAEVI